MNLLTCAACGSRPTEPPRLLAEPPPRLSGDPARQEIGCCGPSGREGPEEVCRECGAVAATRYAV